MQSFLHLLTNRPQTLSRTPRAHLPIYRLKGRIATRNARLEDEIRGFVIYIYWPARDGSSGVPEKVRSEMEAGGAGRDLRAEPKSGGITAAAGILSGVSLLVERLVPVGMLLVAVVSVPVMLWSPSGLARLQALQAQRESLGLEVARLEREIERLRFQAESIKTSPSSIERVARDELGLVRRTELVMQFKRE
jgi:cell division protein FtsB